MHEKDIFSRQVLAHGARRQCDRVLRQKVLLCGILIAAITSTACLAADKLDDPGLALATATQAYLTGRNDEARREFERALAIYRAKANGLGEANVLLGLGHLDATLGRNDEARKHYEDARRLFRVAQNRLGEANVLDGLGDLERILGRNDEAREHYEEARRLFRAEQNRVGEANALRGLAELERKLGRNDEARKYFEDARRLFRAEQNRLGEANVLDGLGDLERILGRNDEARKYYEDARRLFQAVRDRLGEANALSGLGHLDVTLGRNDEARKHYEEARRLFQGEQNRAGEANSLRGLGELERRWGRNDEARKYYEDARLLYQAVQDRLGEANALRGLGDLERNLGRNDEARKYYGDARRLFQAEQDRLGEANVLDGLGDLERILGRNEDARVHYEDARRLFQAEQNRLGEANVLLGLGKLERNLGRDAEARLRFRDAAIYYGLAGMPEAQREAEALALAPAKGAAAEKAVVPPSTPWWHAWQSWGLLSAAVLTILAMFRWYGLRTSSKARDASRNAQSLLETGKRWLNHRTDNRTAVIFVHGILSNPAGFRFSETVSWPQTLYEDSRAGQPNIYLGQYYTATDSGFFDIPAASEELRVQLNSDSADGKQAPLRSERIIFIVHSTGGLVARDLLTRHPDLFKGKQVGLVLVASPSRGSAWANRLNMLIDVANNKMAGQLQKGNEWTDDLDKRFADFVHKDETQRGFSIKGVDLFENRFVAGNFWLFRWLIPTRTVVVSERDSSSYFGAGKMVPGTDHFSIAKPSGVDHPSHQYLMEWWQRAGW